MAALMAAGVFRWNIVGLRMSLENRQAPLSGCHHFPRKKRFKNLFKFRFCNFRKFGQNFGQICYSVVFSNLQTDYPLKEYAFHI